MDYIELEIDSTYATVSDSTLTPQDNPIVNVGRTLTNIVGAKILEVNIPFSYYVITSQINSVTNLPENQFNLRAHANVSMAITPGNYTGTSLAAELQSKISAATNVPGSDFDSPTTSVTYSTVTGKFNIVITQVSNIGGITAVDLFFAELFQPFQPLPKLLGFTSNVATAVATSGNTVFTWTFSNIANVTGPNNLYVNSKILGNICKAYLPEGLLSVGETNPQMAMIPVNVNPGGVIWWQDPAPQEVFDTKNLFSLQRLDLYITAGTDPRPLLFNGLGYQIKLMLFIRNSEQGLPQAGTIGQGRAIMQIRPT
jgi:hypothetical protein